MAGRRRSNPLGCLSACLEYRYKTERLRWLWDASFAGGSLVAAFYATLFSAFYLPLLLMLAGLILRGVAFENGIM